jgi:hypothetical protein
MGAGFFCPEEAPMRRMATTGTTGHFSEMMRLGMQHPGSVRGCVTNLGTLREPPEAPWSRAIQGCQMLAGNRKTLAGSCA